MCEEEEEEQVGLAEEARFVRQATCQAGVGEGVCSNKKVQQQEAVRWTTTTKNYNALCMSRRRPRGGSGKRGEKAKACGCG